ncbi:MAG: nucleotidyltransferase domain-containing protein [Lentisphaerae bacterium]|nr:nucleotidyltransferase domain-containing protein [Lentisphaerota bacterium]
MLTQVDIEKVANDIAQAIHAERIILFGSYANGHADEHSDVDFMVVADSDQPRYKRSRELYQRIKPHRFPLDIIVYTPSEFNHGSKTPVSFVSQVMREGKTIYVRGA